MLFTIHVDDDWPLSIFHVVMAAIAKGELFGSPASAKGDRFSLNDGDMGSDMAVFLKGFIVMLRHFGVHPMVLAEFDAKCTKKGLMKADLLIFA